jgi:hypothetical protein
MNNPPITGIEELDSYLYSLHLFVSNPSTTVGGVVATVDPTSGNPVAYPKQYICIKYADDNIGTGLSNTPTGKMFWGINNSASSTESTNPADYTWYATTAGFGSNIYIYYIVTGNRTIKFYTGTTAPTFKWAKESGAAIDLDGLVAPQTISFEEMLNNTITELKLADGAVTATKTNIAALDQATGGLKPSTVSAAQIMNGAVTELKLLDGAVTNTKIQAGSITGDRIAANTIGANQIAANAITANKIEAGAITADKIQASAVTADKINVSQLSAISSNIGTITAGSISANAITAGSGSVGYGYTFSLGSGQTINGYPAAVGGSNSNSAGMGISGYITSTASNGWGATTGATVAPNGLGGAFYNATSTSFNSFYTFGGLAQGSWGGSFIYHRSPGTYNNGTLPPYSIAYGGTSDGGIYAAYWGNSAPGRLNEAFIANASTGFAGVFRKYSGGTTLVTEANLCTDSYSYFSTAGAVYSAAHYLPFTGAHDGLVDKEDQYESGDIVIDEEVISKLDISNSIVRFKRSTQPNQKGVIGVFVESFDTPPSDWDQSVEIPDPNYGAYEVTPTEVRPNPMAYDVPSTMKVAHVNALGEGLINVCGENGNIEKGDLIVTSSIPGKGMKQSDDIVRSITVAKARENMSFSSPTEIKQIACIYLAG